MRENASSSFSGHYFLALSFPVLSVCLDAGAAAAGYFLPLLPNNNSRSSCHDATISHGV